MGILIILEQISSILGQRHVDMHSGSVHAVFRLRHKGSVQTVTFCNGFYHQFEGHNVICRKQRFIIFKIDFMLGRCIFVMGRLHLKPHILQRQYHISSGILAEIQWSHVKIACLLMGNGGGQSVIIHMVQEELALRSYIEGVSKRRCFTDYLFQNIPGIPLIAGAVRAVNVADQAGYFSLLGSPWEHGKGAVIRIEIHIALLHPHKTLCGRTVKHEFVVQRLFQMAGSDCHIFHISKKIRKLQTDKFHVFFLYHLQNIFLRISHFPAPFPVCFYIGQKGVVHLMKTPLFLICNITVMHLFVNKWLSA